MIQFLIHAWGDYITQSDWMAQNKTKSWLPALVHATVYSLGFLLLRPSLLAFTVILGTHYLIDRYRLARYIVWAKNWLGAWGRESQSDFVDRLNRISLIEAVHETRKWYPPTPTFAECAATGYPPTAPPWLAFWLLIIADNIIHLTINYAALRWL